MLRRLMMLILAVFVLLPVSALAEVTDPVKRGDTLVKIAEKHGTTAQAMFDANKGTGKNQIKIARLIYEGQTFIIPPKAENDATAAKSASGKPNQGKPAPRRSFSLKRDANGVAQWIVAGGNPYGNRSANAAIRKFNLPQPVKQYFLEADWAMGKDCVIEHGQHFEQMVFGASNIVSNLVWAGKGNLPARYWTREYEGKLYTLYRPEVCANWAWNVTEAAKKAEEAPPAKAEEAPPAKAEEAPPAKAEEAPPAKVEEAPPAKVEEAPSAKVEEAPSAKVEEAPPAKVEEVPPKKGYVPFDTFRDVDAAVGVFGEKSFDGKMSVGGAFASASIFPYTYRAGDNFHSVGVKGDASSWRGSVKIDQPPVFLVDDRGFGNSGPGSFNSGPGSINSGPGSINSGSGSINSGSGSFDDRGRSRGSDSINSGSGSGSLNINNRGSGSINSGPGSINSGSSSINSGNGNVIAIRRDPLKVDFDGERWSTEGIYRHLTPSTDTRVSAGYGERWDRSIAEDQLFGDVFVSRQDTQLLTANVSHEVKRDDSPYFNRVRYYAGGDLDIGNERTEVAVRGNTAFISQPKGQNMSSAQLGVDAQIYDLSGKKQNVVLAAGAQGHYQAANSNFGAKPSVGFDFYDKSVETRAYADLQSKNKDVYGGTALLNISNLLRKLKIGKSFAYAEGNSGKGVLVFEENVE